MIHTLDDFVVQGLAAGADAPAAVARKALEEMASESTSGMLKMNKGKLLDTLKLLAPDNTTLARLCVHRVLDITPEHLAELYDTLRLAVPSHIGLALDLLCEVVKRLVAVLAGNHHLRATQLEFAGAVQSVVAKIDALGTYPDVLLPLHTDLLHLYLRSGHPERGLELAQRRFTSVYRAGAESRAALAFHYYAGVVFAAAGQYPRAEQCFELVYRSPRPAKTSWVVLCAYLKYVLTALIVRGQLPKGTKFDMPRRDERFDMYMEYMASSRGGDDERGLSARLEEYARLAELVAARNVPAVRGFVNANAAMLRADGNLGLAKRLEQRMLQHLLLAAADVYDSCSYAKLLRSGGFRSPDQSDAAQLREAAEELQRSGALALVAGDHGVRFLRAPLDTHDTRGSAFALEESTRAMHWWAATADAKCEELEAWALESKAAHAAVFDTLDMLAGGHYAVDLDDEDDG